MIAASGGIVFDNHAFVPMGAVAGRLPGAVMAVANASNRALERAMVGTEHRRSSANAEKRVACLAGIFPRGAIVRALKIRGDSKHEWAFDAAVTTETSRLVFEIVMPHPTSIAFAATEFLRPRPVGRQHVQNRSQQSVNVPMTRCCLDLSIIAPDVCRELNRPEAGQPSSPPRC